MNMIRSFIQKPASPALVEYTLCFVRIAIGLLTIGHGIPKIIGGPDVWLTVGTPISLIGIHFLPTAWGLLAGCAEALGGLAFVLGLGTRLAALPLSFMMVVAFIMHWHNGDPYNVYSFALTMLVIFIAFLFIGSGRFSLDYYFYHKSKSADEYHPLMNRPEDYL